MNKIVVEVSVGELLDKISILEIKKEKIKDPEKLRFINNEHDVLKDQFLKNVKSDEKLDSLFKFLKEINNKLWVIEDDKRLCEKNSDFGDEFIKLSRDVHFLNDERALSSFKKCTSLDSFINSSPKSEFFSHNLLSSSITQSLLLISLRNLNKLSSFSSDFTFLRN